MITTKAVRQVLDGITEHEQDYCFSADPDCECELDHDAYAEPPAYGITYVTDRGDLDKPSNRHVWGTAWGTCGDLEEALDQPTEFPDHRDVLVVIERATGHWRPAADYFS